MGRVLKRIMPGRWTFEWVGILLLFLAGLEAVSAIISRRLDKTWLLQTEGEFAIATIVGVRVGTMVSRRRSDATETVRTSKRYFVDLEWRDYHKTRQFVDNLVFWEAEGQKLNLHGGLGEAAKTIRIRYKLTETAPDDTIRKADAEANELNDRLKLPPICTPSNVCRNVIVDNPSMVDPGESNVLLLGDPKPFLLWGGLSIFCGFFFARLAGKLGDDAI